MLFTHLVFTVHIKSVCNSSRARCMPPTAASGKEKEKEQVGITCPPDRVPQTPAEGWPPSALPLILILEWCSSESENRGGVVVPVLPAQHGRCSTGLRPRPGIGCDHHHHIQLPRGNRDMPMLHQKAAPQFQPYGA